MNTNNIDYQGYWDELPSQTQLRRMREENKWNPIQQQLKKKQRRGGNRKLNHFRKACRAKQSLEQRIKMLIEMNQANKSIQKRKEDVSTWNSSHTIKSSIDKKQVR